MLKRIEINFLITITILVISWQCPGVPVQSTVQTRSLEGLISVFGWEQMFPLCFDRQLKYIFILYKLNIFKLFGSGKPS